MWVGSADRNAWLATMSRRPRNIALDGLSNGTDDPSAANRAASVPSGLTTAIWLASSNVT